MGSVSSVIYLFVEISWSYMTHSAGAMRKSNAPLQNPVV
jgi:hypothetical protein